jgi:hypothetical protein
MYSYFPCSAEICVVVYLSLGNIITNTNTYLLLIFINVCSSVVIVVDKTFFKKLSCVLNFNVLTLIFFQKTFQCLKFKCFNFNGTEHFLLRTVLPIRISHLPSQNSLTQYRNNQRKNYSTLPESLVI